MVFIASKYNMYSYVDEFFHRRQTAGIQLVIFQMNEQCFALYTEIFDIARN